MRPAISSWPAPSSPAAALDDCGVQSTVQLLVQERTSTDTSGARIMGNWNVPDDIKSPSPIKSNHQQHNSIFTPRILRVITSLFMADNRPRQTASWHLRTLLKAMYYINMETANVRSSICWCRMKRMTTIFYASTTVPIRRGSHPGYKILAPLLFEAPLSNRTTFICG